jgi:hypothetical protein
MQWREAPWYGSHSGRSWTAEWRDSWLNWSIVCLIVPATISPAASQSCDELVGRLLRKPIQQSLQQLGCDQLGRAGLDKANHELKSICYIAGGSVSSLEVVAGLSCKTSEAAFIKASVSETITAKAKIDGLNCRVTEISFSAPGEGAKLLLAYSDANGRARAALQAQLNSVCAP